MLKNKVKGENNGFKEELKIISIILTACATNVVQKLDSLNNKILLILLVKHVNVFDYI